MNRNKIGWIFGIGILGLGLIPNEHSRPPIPLLAGSISPKGTLDSFPLPTTFGFGRPASPSEIAKLDIDIRPDGLGLPAGAGTAAEGKPIYDLKCAACHGVGGIGGPNGSLAINPATPAGRREKVIGNYWPYATTIFDYVRRAMPFNRPGSLTDEEVYKLIAYLLYLNQLLDEKASIDAQTLPKIAMPAQKSYVRDDRQGGPQIK
jgi:cytochrome c